MAKVLELQFQHQAFQWIFRFDFPRIDWFDLLAAQGTLKSLLQHHSSKASILWQSAFFMVQLSHAYMTTGKIIALTIQTFVSKVMSPLFNTLSRFVIAFQGASIFSFHSPSAGILELRKTKSLTVSIVSPCICHEVSTSCKMQVGWLTSWNQDYWEKYQQPQMCRWYHGNGRKERRTKEPLDEGERVEWKSCLKSQHSKDKVYGIWSHGK